MSTFVNTQFGDGFAQFSGNSGYVDTNLYKLMAGYGVDDGVGVICSVGFLEIQVADPPNFINDARIAWQVGVKDGGGIVYPLHIATFSQNVASGTSITGYEGNFTANLYLHSDGHLAFNLQDSDGVFYDVCTSAAGVFPVDGTVKGVEVLINFPTANSIIATCYVNNVNVMSGSYTTVPNIFGQYWYYRDPGPFGPQVPSGGLSLVQLQLTRSTGGFQRMISIAEVIVEDNSSHGAYPDSNATPAILTSAGGCSFRSGFGMIKVVKIVDPDTDPETFEINLDGSPVADIGHGDTWYISVPGGTYDITETPNASYTTVYSVSNGNPHDAIVVPSGFTRTVTITNTFAVAATGTISVVKVTVPTEDTTSFGFTTGSTLTPDVFSLASGDSEFFAAVPVGAGYKIYETPNSFYTTGYSVSNGDPHDAISVADGENVIVTVTNTGLRLPGSGIYVIIPDTDITSDTVVDAFAGTTIPTIVTSEEAIPTPMFQTGMLEDK